MARLPAPGGDNGTWGAILNDYLNQTLAADGTIKDGVVTEDNLDAALQAKIDQSGGVTSVAGKTGDVTLVQDDIGDLTTDLAGKAELGANSDITSLTGLTTPLSVAQGGTASGSAQTALNTLSNVGAATNEYVLTKDTGSGNAVFKAIPSAAYLSEQTFTVTSVLAVAAGNPRWYAPYSLTITEVRASVGTQPTGASIIVDVNKNGTTIFTTQSNRPTIAAATNTDLADGINITSLVAGDYLTVDVDQIGSSVAGSDLTVTIKYTIS